MATMSVFRKQIMFCDAVIGAVILAIWLIIDPNLYIVVGIAAGTVVAALSFLIMAITGQRLVVEGRKGPIVWGYFLRLPIYGLVFFVCIRWNMICGAGCAIGFMTTPLAIFILFGIRSLFPGARKNPLNDSDEPREWKNLDDDGWDDEDD